MKDESIEMRSGFYYFLSSEHLLRLSHLWDEGSCSGSVSRGPGSVPSEHTPDNRLLLIPRDAQTNGWTVCPL